MEEGCMHSYCFRLHHIILGLALGCQIVVFSQNALANLNDCNPTVLKETSDRFTATLLCSSLDTKYFHDCIKTLKTAGVGSFLAGMGIKASAKDTLRNTAAKADMASIRKYFSGDIRQLIDKLKDRSGGIADTTKLIAEMSKHPRLYSNQITNLMEGLRWAKVGTLLEAVGTVGLVWAYLEATAFTPPEDCKVLNWEGIDREDKKWVDFGYNCTRHISSAFFEQGYEDQLKIVQRSPEICKSVSSFNQELTDRLVDSPPAMEDPKVYSGATFY